MELWWQFSDSRPENIHISRGTLSKRFIEISEKIDKMRWYIAYILEEGVVQ